MREELGAVMYASNVLGSRGPRKMKVVVPKVRGDGVTRIAQRPMKKREEMLSRFKDDDTSEMVVMMNKPPRWNEQVGAYVLNFNGRVTMARHVFLQQHNTTHTSKHTELFFLLALPLAAFTVSSHAFTHFFLLSFSFLSLSLSRFSNSVKNFQLVTPEDQEAVLLQFGRVGKDLFTMDYQHPLSPFQAFAICLSSFDSKLACE